jgi:acetyl-CoA synthetase
VKVPAPTHTLVARYAPIAKDPSTAPQGPNLADYAQTRAAFSWDAARRLLDHLPGGRGLNIAHEAVDRHATGPRGGRVALRWIGRTGTRREFTYRDLRAETNRFANALQALGVAPGERVFVLAGRIPELYVTVLGALKARCVVSPLFSQFGPEPLATRLTLGDGRVLVTTEALYRRKIEGLRARLPGLRHVILVGEDGAPSSVGDTLDWTTTVLTQSGDFEIPPTAPDDMALLHFTSGTTGRPTRITSRASTRSISTTTTSSGAPPTPAGSPARATASSRR